MSIAITGASGQLGRATTTAVLELLDDPSELVLLTRTPEQLEDLAARGATVRRADFNEPASLAGALAGVERLLLISTDVVGSRVEGQVAAIEAAKQAGVSHVIYTSVTRPEASNPAAVVPDHAATEEALRASGLAWTFLQDNLYSQFQIPVIQQAGASGSLVTNTGGGATAYVDRGDVAAVAAVVLTDGGYEGEALDVTGPQALTAADLAALATEFSGNDVGVVDLDDATYTQGLVDQAGLPEHVAAILASFGRATREGYLGEVSDVVERVTGRPARSVRDVVAEALAAAPSA